MLVTTTFRLRYNHRISNPDGITNFVLVLDNSIFYIDRPRWAVEKAIHCVMSHKVLHKYYTLIKDLTEIVDNLP